MLESVKGRGYLEELGIDENIILTWIFGNRFLRCKVD
jgi:hypothetical protein